jgi:hypothetical protein
MSMSCVIDLGIDYCIFVFLYKTAICTVVLLLPYRLIELEKGVAIYHNPLFKTLAPRHYAVVKAKWRHCADGPREKTCRGTGDPHGA